MNTEKKRVTKEEIAQVLDMWSDTKVDDIAAKLNRGPSTVHHIVKLIREAGYDLPRKPRHTPQPYVRELILEVLKEKSLIPA